MLLFIEALVVELQHLNVRWYHIAFVVCIPLVCYIVWKFVSKYFSNAKLYMKKQHALDIRNDSIVKVTAYLKSSKSEDRDLYAIMKEGNYVWSELVSRYSCSDIYNVILELALEAQEATNCITQFIAPSIVEGQLKTAALQPLKGLPISLKENFLLEGNDATGGVMCRFGKFVSNTSPLITWLQSQGAVPFCRTNACQFMLSYESENFVFGRTTYPYDKKSIHAKLSSTMDKTGDELPIDRTPGGSSAGEGALVGMNGSVIGVGGDILGSLRIPAHFCGLHTLKPTSGRFIVDPCKTSSCNGNVSMRPIVESFPSAGFMTKDIDLLINLHRLMYREETFQQYPMMTPVVFNEKLFQCRPSSIKIGVMLHDGLVKSTPCVVRAIGIARERLSKCGYELVDFTIPRPAKAVQLSHRVMLVDGMKDVFDELAEEPKVLSSLQCFSQFVSFPRFVRWLFTWISSAVVGPIAGVVLGSHRSCNSAYEVTELLRDVRDYQAEVLAAVKASGVDVIVCPPAPTAATRFGDYDAVLCGPVSLCYAFNLLNYPAGVVSPITRVTKEDEAATEKEYVPRDHFSSMLRSSMMNGSLGLPVGVQVAALPNREELVLKVMRDLVM